MPKYLFTVQDCYCVPGRFLALTPGYRPYVDQIKPGDEVELRRPDGTVLVGIVGPGSEMGPHFSHESKAEFRSALPIRPPLTEEDVPISTEVWWVEEKL